MSQGSRPSAGQFDILLLVLIVVVAIGIAGAFLVFSSAFAAKIALGVVVLPIVVAVLSPRRPPNGGRLIAGSVAGLSVLVLVIQAVALFAISAGALRISGETIFAVWNQRGRLALVRALRTGSPDQRAWAAGELRPFGKSAVPDWTAAMRDSDPRVRAASLGGLSQYPDPSLEPLFQEAARDSDPSVAGAASVALARGGGLESCRAMAKLATEHPTGAGREAIDAVLGILKRDYSIAEKCVSDSDPKVRLGTVEALDEIQHGKALTLLLASCKDSDLQVRTSALRGVGPVIQHLVRQGENPMAGGSDLGETWNSGSPSSLQIDADQVLGQLLTLAQSGEEAIREEAIRCLRTMIQDFPPEGKYSKSELVSRPISPRTYERLLDLALSLKAARAPEPQLEPILIPAFVDKRFAATYLRGLASTSVGMRRTCAWMLGNIGDRSYITALTSADSSYTADQAYYCADCDTYTCQFCEAIARIAPGTRTAHQISFVRMADDAPHAPGKSPPASGGDHVKIHSP